MFFNSLSRTSKDLGFLKDSENYQSALASILYVASITNSMMWIGKIKHCPVDLSRQGMLIKDGPVCVGSNWRRNANCLGQVMESHYLILFQRSLIVCRRRENPADQESPVLLYSKHFSLNELKIINVVQDKPSTFIIQKTGRSSDKRREADEEGVTKIECESSTETVEWVRAINTEVKDLVSFARRLSSFNHSSSLASLVSL